MLTYGDGVSDVNLRICWPSTAPTARLATVTAVRPPARFGGLDFDGDLRDRVHGKAPDRRGLDQRRVLRLRARRSSTTSSGDATIISRCEALSGSPRTASSPRTSTSTSGSAWTLSATSARSRASGRADRPPGWSGNGRLQLAPPYQGEVACASSSPVTTAISVPSWSRSCERRDTTSSASIPSSSRIAPWATRRTRSRPSARTSATCEVSDLEGFDAVVHLAALCNDPLGDLNQDWTYDINHHASVHLARLSREAGVRRFLFASSCSMYGAAGDEILTDGAPAASDRLRGVQGADRGGRVEAGRRHLQPGLHAQRDRLRSLAPICAPIVVLNNLVCWAQTTGRSGS